MCAHYNKTMTQAKHNCNTVHLEPAMQVLGGHKVPSHEAELLSAPSALKPFTWLSGCSSRAWAVGLSAATENLSRGNVA